MPPEVINRKLYQRAVADSSEFLFLEGVRIEGKSAQHLVLLVQRDDHLVDGDLHVQAVLLTLLAGLILNT